VLRSQGNSAKALTAGERRPGRGLRDARRCLGHRALDRVAEVA